MNFVGCYVYVPPSLMIGRRVLAALLVLHASPTSGFFTSRAPAYRPHATGSLHPAFQQPLSLSATMASPTAINAEAHDSGVSSHTGHEHSIKRSSVSQDLAAEPFELVRTDLKDLKVRMMTTAAVSSVT